MKDTLREVVVALYHIQMYIYIFIPSSGIWTTEHELYLDHGV